MFEIRRTLQSDGFPDLSRISKYRPYHSVLETFPDILHDTDFFCILIAHLSTQILYSRALYENSLLGVGEIIPPIQFGNVKS